MISRPIAYGTATLNAILQQAGFDLTARELAEIIWLAVHIEESEQSQQQLQQQSQQLNPPETQTQETPEIASSPQVTESGAEVSLPSSVASSAKSPETREAIAIKVPAAVALRNSLALGRALRPLMRKIPSPTENILDEEATVYRIAQEKIWVPVLKPAPERWLELALVVEQSSSTAIWKQTITELQRLLKHHGAFRDVRTWELKVTETKAQLFPQNSTGAYSSTPYSPEVLIDSKGQRLILLVSDCISPAWRNKFIHPLLELWGRKGLMTILQLLPERLWERTALASEIPVQLHSLNPGVFNSQLIVETWDDDITDEIENTLQKDANKIKNPIPVPIVTLEPEPLLLWSRVIAGLGNVKTAGFKFSSEFSSVDGVEHSDTQQFTEHKQLNLTPAALVSRFRATASPLARRLAGLMAAAPVSLPVVQLIQQTLLPQSSQIHAAEVFMSGLLKPLTSIHQNTDANYIEYEFVEGIRELLLESVPVSKTISVIDNVSEFVAKRLGLSVREFEARLLVPASGGEDSLETKIRPFAQLKAQVLRQLGGEYARLADELEQQTIEENTTDTISKIWDNRHLLWQQNNTKIYSFGKFSPWSLPFDTLVISVSNSISNSDFWEGRMVKTFRDFLGRQNFILFRNTVYDVWEQNNRTIISPDNPLLIPLPSEINNQLSLSDEYQPNRFVILATVQSPHPSINNTTQAIEAAIRLAAEQRLTRVALPLLGTGGHGLPVYQVATAIVSTINKVLKALPSNSIQEITLISQEKSAITTLREVVQDLDQQNKKSAHSHRLLDFDFEVVTVNHRGEIIKRETKQAQYFTEDLGNSITLEMVAIPSGKFMMGSPEGEGNESEKPQHEVTIQPLFMGKYPVTQAQWQSVAALPRVNRDLDPDPSHFKGDNRPVEQICWYDVVEFCARLSKKIGREYRLPSEAEWEYACRAGTTTPFHFGETITNNLANYRPRRIFANEPKGESQEETTPIRTFPPNAFGLYDMHGNVWEWCADAWHENYQEAPTDGSAWEKVNNDDDLIRLLRGGSWPFSPAYCRSAYRYSYDADDRYNTFGFRVVCSAAARTVQ